MPRVERGPEAESDGPRRRLRAPLTEALALDPTRQRHHLRDRLSGAERTVDYRALVDKGLELEVGPYGFVLLGPPVDSLVS